MKLIYLLDGVDTGMFSGEEKDGIFLQRLIFEFQSGRSDGHFISKVHEKEYQEWYKNLPEENVCYCTFDRLYKKTIKYDKQKTLFLLAYSFENSFQGSSGYVKFSSKRMQRLYLAWVDERNRKMEVLYRSKK